MALEKRREPDANSPQQRVDPDNPGDESESWRVKDVDIEENNGGFDAEEIGRLQPLNNPQSLQCVSGVTVLAFQISPTYNHKFPKILLGHVLNVMRQADAEFYGIGQYIQVSVCRAPRMTYDKTDTQLRRW